MKAKARGDPPNPPLPPPGSSLEGEQCIWRCPLVAVVGRAFCEEQLPPGSEDNDDLALGGADSLRRISQGIRD